MHGELALSLLLIFTLDGILLKYFAPLNHLTGGVQFLKFLIL